MAQRLYGSFRKVVVVEDDPTLLFFWGRLLKELGIEDYELFSDAVEAKMLLQEIPCQLLISDIVMPGAYGYELARIARRRSPNCTIVLTTGYGTDLSRFELSDCRFHLLHKPYTDIAALKVFIGHLVENDESFDDLSEDSFSENEDYPQVTEWKL